MTRIAFASCARIRYRNQNHDGAPPYGLNTKDFNQPVWEHLLVQHTQKPLDALLLLGDQVYTDYCAGDRPRDWNPDVFHALLYAMYAAQYTQVPAFKALMQALHSNKTPVGVIWDDHDFGYNNGYGTDPAFQDKLGSTQVLFDQFCGVLNSAPSTYPPMPVRPVSTPTRGIERISNGLSLDAGVEIVLLDGRWYRQSTKSAPPQLLGEAQWLELKEKMQSLPNGKLLIVCLGSTYSAGGLLADESWAQKKKGKPYAYFAEFTQLAQEKHIIFLSGDIHKNDFIEHGGFCEIISSGAYAPKEISCPATLLAPNRHRYGLLDIDAAQVQVKLFADNQIEDMLSKIIFRATGMPMS
jgi:PhoD-like phosphatase